MRTKGEKHLPINAVGLQFGKLTRAAKLHRSGLAFYALRHTSRTIMDETRDFAIDLIMGHARNDLASLHRERIDDSRLATAG